MSELTDRIDRRLRRERFRERGLLVSRSILQSSGVLLLTLSLAAWAYSSGGERAEVRDTLGAFALVGLLLGTTLPLVLRWPDTGDLRNQARHMERWTAELGHRLITAFDRRDGLVELEEGAKPVPSGVSRVLLERATRRAVEVMDEIPGNAIHPWAQLRFPAGFMGVGLLAFVLASLTQQIGPIRALSYAFSERPALVRLQSMAPEEVLEEVMVGDIVLRYFYPDYTGLSVLEVTNSDGTIHGPAGTRVQIMARTAEPYEFAMLEVTGQEAVQVALQDGRDIAAELSIRESGEWRILLMRGNETHTSPGYPIVLEVDTPPVVTLQMPDRDEHPMDQSLSIGWSVQDDYGLDRVVLEVRTADGEVREIPLRSPEEPIRDLRGVVEQMPSELGLRPGDTVTLQVVAYDNDAAGGNNRGESEAVEITIGGANGGGPRLMTYHRELRDAMIPVLADFLEESLPPYRTAADMNGWASELSLRFEPVQEIYEMQWGSRGSNSLDAELVGAVIEDARQLSRYVITTWNPSSTRRVTPQDLATLAEMHGDVILSLEMAIYVIDRVLRQAALAEVVEQAERLASEAEDLAVLPEDVASGEMLARLDRLERLLRELGISTQELSETGLEEFVNSRSRETTNLMDQVREAIAEGRLEEARELLDQVAEQVQQVAESLADQLARQEQEQSELSDAIQQLREDLQQLADDQDALAMELEEAREEMGEELQQQMDWWRELDELSDSAMASARLVLDSVGHGQGWLGTSIQTIEQMLIPSVESVGNAITARDASSAMVETYAALRAHRRATDAIFYERRRSRNSTEVFPSGLDAASTANAALGEDLEAITDILQALQESTATEPPELRRFAQQMSEEQRELGERQERLARDLRRVEQALPTADGSASEYMSEGGQSMERADEALLRGESMSGEDHQRAASRYVREARERLEQQMQQAAQMQQLSRQMQEGGGSSHGDGGSSEERLAPEDFILPVPESFQTPEEYRRALLEGMEADVPEEYRTMNQRYFEELVRQ